MDLLDENVPKTNTKKKRKKKKGIQWLLSNQHGSRTDTCSPSEIYSTRRVNGDLSDNDDNDDNGNGDDDIDDAKSQALSKSGHQKIKSDRKEP